MAIFSNLSPHAPKALGALRIVSSLLFIAHGTQKLFAFPVGFPMEMNAMLYAAAVIELITGILMLIGFQTRIAAFLASGTMAVAYWLGHAPMSPWPVANMGDAAILFCFVFLYLVFAGPGAWSIDKD
ncbi:MAG: DoxX family protein [Devosia sp.]